MSFTNWRKASRSNNNGAGCVWVATDGDLVAIKEADDPADPTVPATITDRHRFSLFVAAVKDGEFDDMT